MARHLSSHMMIVRDPKERLPLDSPLALAIGNFDGIHRGHQRVLEQVKRVAKTLGAKPAVLTYVNHPSHALSPATPTPLIYGLDHKMLLLQEMGIEYTLLFTFDLSFAQQKPEEFLHKLHCIAPFSYLNLGHDGRIGQRAGKSLGREEEREKNRTLLQQLAQQWQFHLDHTEPHRIEGETPSSSTIRKEIGGGQLQRASFLLGRPYSILGIVRRGQGRGSLLGFPTANLSLDGLITPPQGVWIVEALHRGIRHRAIANIGTAPTFTTNSSPHLEVHLLVPPPSSLYGEVMEVFFLEFVRPERQFTDGEELRKQLQIDTEVARGDWKK